MPKPTNYPKLSVAIRQARTATGTKIETLAAAFAVSEATMYDVVGEDACWDDRFSAIYHAVAVLDPVMSDAIKSALVPPPVDVFHDFNHDGVHDKSDARSGLAQVVSGSGDLIGRLEKTGERFTADEAAELTAQADDAIRKILGVKTLIAKLTLSGPRSSNAA